MLETSGRIPADLARAKFDAIIIGAGINGAGLARDAAMRGEPAPPKPEAPKLGPAPEPSPIEKEPDSLDGYINFLHPWGHPLGNPAILVVMFFLLVGVTIAALRAQDIG